MAEGTQRLLQRGENFILAYEDRNAFIVAPAYNEPITTLREIKLEPESAVDVAPSPGGLAVFQSSGVDVTNGVRRTARERKSVTPLKSVMSLCALVVAIEGSPLLPAFFQVIIRQLN